jgi:hypothetical protein
MKLLKRPFQLLICILATIFCFELYLTVCSYISNEYYKMEVTSLIPIGLGIGWGVFQVLFIRLNRIRERGGLPLLDLIALTFQSSMIIFIGLFIALSITGNIS